MTGHGDLRSSPWYCRTPRPPSWRVRHSTTPRGLDHTASMPITRRWSTSVSVTAVSPRPRSPRSSRRGRRAPSRGQAARRAQPAAAPCRAHAAPSRARRAAAPVAPTPLASDARMVGARRQPLHLTQESAGEDPDAGACWGTARPRDCMRCTTCRCTATTDASDASRRRERSRDIGADRARASAAIGAASGRTGRGAVPSARVRRMHSSEIGPTAAAIVKPRISPRASEGQVHGPSSTR